MTEQEWIRRAQGGDAEAFAALVRLHQEGVYGFCLRMTGRREDALDLTSEAFLRAYRSLAGFDVTQPFRPWLLRIAANLCRDHLRARQQHPAPVEDAVLAHLPDPAPPPPGQVLAAHDRAAVRQAVAELPEPYRTTITLHYFNQLSYQEISEVLNIPVGTVGTHLYRAKRLLRKRLVEQEVVT